MTDIFNIPLTALPSVANKRATLLTKLNITNIYTLLTHYPRNYIDYTSPKLLNEVTLDENNVFEGTIVKKHGTAFLKNNLKVSKATLKDDNDDTITVTYFNNPYVYDSLKLYESYVFYGKITKEKYGYQCTSPLSIKKDDNPMQPIYPLTAGISNKILLNLIKCAYDKYNELLIEFIPDDIRIEYSLATLEYAFYNIHFPPDMDAYTHAKNRLAFNELLLLQVGLLKLKSNTKAQTSIKITNFDLYDFYNNLNFKLTNAQQKAINQCLHDFTLDTPMNRLVQGDVGSGKTMVALALAHCMSKNNYQTILMVPTEILAVQHYQTFKKYNLNCCLLTGSIPLKQKKELYDKIAQGEIDIIIGTHAVISDNVVYHNLGLVITDEQHRFGVNQRGKLQKKGEFPHTLVMSATPIPRTLALIIYGDLDISIIDEMPIGRLEIQTFSVSDSKRARVMGLVKKQIDLGHQAYIVCPAIEDSSTGLFSVIEYAQQLKKTFLGEYKIGVLHGKLNQAEKDNIMLAFKDGDIDILISTTVVEVGVDVANATIMVIENSERFGLSALHQLRGRVGRSNHQSYCILISQGGENNLRLKKMCETNDGFLIAKEDLSIRGPGDFFGNKQHGLPLLKIANMIDDIELVNKTQVLAKEILREDRNLSSDKYKELNAQVERLFSSNEQDFFN